LAAIESLYSPQSRAERLIAAGRVVLAVSSLFAVWLDPAEPAKYADVAYSLLAAYVVYAAAIAFLVWHSDAPSDRLLQKEEGNREAAEVLTPRELEIVRMVARGMRTEAGRRRAAQGVGVGGPHRQAPEGTRDGS
jgi:DNA-binding NarL/FixJ family response regulator